MPFRRIKSLRFSLAPYLGIPKTFDIGVDMGNPVMAGYLSGAPFRDGISDILFDLSKSGPGGDLLLREW